MLGRLKFDDEVLEWVRDALHASHADERREHEEGIKRYQAEYKRLQDRINAMYVDKLDGLVDKGFVTPFRACGSADGSVAKGMKKISYRGYRFPPEIIHQAIWLISGSHSAYVTSKTCWRNGASWFPTRPFGAG